MARQQEKGPVPQHVRDAYQRGYDDGQRQIAIPIQAAFYAPGPVCVGCDSVAALMAADLGHVRLIAQDAGKLVYAKAAIRTPIYPRHYVLYTATGYPSPADYLSGLLDKVQAVYEGRLRPSPDEYRG